MFYILFLILYKIYLIISLLPLLEKRVQRNKKSHFFRVTLKNFLEFINSRGESQGDLSWESLKEPDIRNRRKRYISRPFHDHYKFRRYTFFNNKRGFKLNWTISINNKSFGKKKENSLQK